MKKRVFSILIAALLAVAMCVPAFAWSYPTSPAPTNLMDLKDADAPQLYGVQVATAPTIDGNVDDVWDKASNYASGGYSISILWDNDNIYLLETRTDNVIVGTTGNDTVTQWNPAFDMSLFTFATSATMENNKCAMVAVYIAPSTELNGKAVGETDVAYVSMRELIFTNISNGSQSKPWSASDANVRAQREKISAACARTATGYLNEVCIPWSALCFGNTAAVDDNAYEPALDDQIGFRGYYYQKGTGDSGNTIYTGSTGGDNGGFNIVNLVKRAPSLTIDIDNAADFKDIIEEAANGNNFAGYTINLKANIDLNPGWNGNVTINGSSYTPPDPAAYEWPVIPSFAGTLNGNGHTLSGIYLEDSATTLAPITTLTGTICNLAITNSFICGTNASGRGSSLAGGSKIGGLVGNLQTGATLENIYTEATVWAVSWSAQSLGGLIAYLPANDSTIRNVVAKGVVGSSKPGAGAQDVNSSEGCRASAIIGDANWKSGVLLDQVVLAADIYLNASALASSAAYGANNKFSTGDMYRKPSNCVNGKFATFAEAEAAGAVLNTAGTVTNTYAFSPLVGGIAPASVVHMFDYNLAVQQKSAYVLADKNSVDHSVIDIRLLSVVNDLDVCNRMGFKVSVKVGDADALERTITVSEVYTSIQAAGATVTAAELGGKYISALVLEGVSATENVAITVTPVKVIGEVTYEDPTPYVISVAAGEIQ